MMLSKYFIDKSSSSTLRQTLKFKISRLRESQQKQVCKFSRCLHLSLSIYSTLTITCANNLDKNTRYHHQHLGTLGCPLDYVCFTTQFFYSKSLQRNIIPLTFSLFKQLNFFFSHPTTATTTSIGRWHKQ